MAVLRHWRIFKRTGQWDDVIEGLDTGLVDQGTMVVSVGDLLALPLRETILAVIKQMPDEAAPEHLAAQIELQVRGWIENRLHAL